MTTLLSPDRVRALLKTPTERVTHAKPPPRKLACGISRGQLLTMQRYLILGASQIEAARLAGISPGSAVHASLRIKKELEQ